MKSKFQKPPKEVSERMKKVRGKDTGIEKAMEKILRSLGIEYEKQPHLSNLAGRPDFRIRGTKVLIFCDSSFWHGRRKEEVTGEAFRRNKDFWTHKLNENRKRDRRINRSLKKEGWSVYRFWDTDILKSPKKVMRALEQVLIENKLVGFSAVDLFCGVGAVTHGLIKAGMPVNAGIDNDGSCKYAYEKNNRTKFVEKDIRGLSGAFVKKLYPDKHIRILVGCAPCQPFSKHTLKNKNRNEDEKWGLLYSFSDIIRKVKPHVISMENVPEITNQKVFSDFVENLKSSGYHIFWKIVYCPDYGIPQSRKRLVLLASRLGEIKLLPGTHEPSRYRTVRQTIGKLEPIGDGEIFEKDPLHRTSKLSPLNKRRIKQSRPGGTWREWEEDLRSPCHRKKSGRSYGGVYARMEWDKLAPTITTQFYGFGTGRFGHPEQDRALSLREGALLQTFPKYYDFIDPKEEVSLKKTGIHIGNAVPVKLGAIIGKSIINHIRSLKNDE